MPRHQASDAGAGGDHPFRVDPAVLAAATEHADAIARADRVVAGEYQAYRTSWRRLPDDPAGWLRHPILGSQWSGDTSWWKVSHLDPAAGDIKDLWEPARFGWVYDLVRAYVVSREDRYAEAFVSLLRSWHESSPAFQGPHWSCGQETSIRAIALLYAEGNFGGSPTLVGRSAALLRSVLSASGERIADAHGYAISQRNNHAISEAAALVALGDRFRGAHPEAARWYATGRRNLNRLVEEQFAADGWYIQHSFTYLRLALDQCVVAQRVLQRHGDSISPAGVARIGAAVELLAAVIDPETGAVPNHGANDGAFVHPVTLAEYRDFRPVLTAVCGTFDLPFPDFLRPDPEPLAWLGTGGPRRVVVRLDGVRSGASGWAAARSGGTAVFIRAGEYSSRPGHIDPLHLDVRVGGREVVVDPGTFAYNAPPPWNNGLSGARAHNGPLLDDQEPGLRGPRFLWYVWPRAALVSAAWEDGVARLVAEVPGRVRRTVILDTAGVSVHDEVLAAGAALLRINWLLHPSAHTAGVEVGVGHRVGQAEPGRTAGWFSPVYGERQASRYVLVEAYRPFHGPVSTRFSGGAMDGGRLKSGSASDEGADPVRNPANRE